MAINSRYTSNNDNDLECKMTCWWKKEIAYKEILFIKCLHPSFKN